MHHVGPLTSGIRGAENGTAEIYQRGTSTRATWYSSFEADGSSTQDAALDANGGADVYVNQLVTVRVKDSNGNTVREFVAGAAASAVEVISQSFSGVDYETGETGAGRPVDLQTVLGRLATSFGTLDFKVLSNGSPVTLSEALSAGFGNQLFNVKADAYGAEGDGVVNDTPAIAAAITAAALVDGVVFFPPGTYNLATGLTVPYNVTLLGCGPNSSILAPSHPSTTHITVTGNAAAVRYTLISGLAILPSAASTGILIRSTTASALNLKIADCLIGNANADATLVSTTGATSATLDMVDCTLVQGDTDTMVVTGTNPGKFRNCRFVPSGGIVFNGQILDIEGCTFDNAGVSGAGVTISTAGANISSTATGQLLWRVVNCTFTAPGTNSIIAIATNASNDVNSSTVIYEWGNTFASGVFPYRVRWGATSKGAVCWLGSRLGKRTEVTNNDATYTITTDLLAYETVVVKRTTNADQTVAYDNTAANYTALPDSNPSAIMVWNESGGDIAAETFSARGAGAAVGITNNLSAYLRMQWLQVESAVGPYAVAPVVATGDPF